VIGWALSGDMETVHTAIPAVDMAFANRKAQEGLLFHSDRGVQYRENLFGTVLWNSAALFARA
ncbi:MAG: hypothetical protein LBK74_00930, partial [Treponema sp.]|nr:hypothetical protein [Treponema sp.]